MAALRQGLGTEEIEWTLRTIFKRCVQCAGGSPSCPTCASNEICSFVPQSCDACAHTVCVVNPNAPPPSSGPSSGAIAGGIIGGLVFVCAAIYLTWRFWLKKKRAQRELEAAEWERDNIARLKSGQVFNAMRSDAASTRTRGSFAASFLSRASNFIQIAYIPGITNRNGSNRNTVNESTPVPPIPAQYASVTPGSPLNNAGDAIFFHPGDLRGSTYSGISTLRPGNRDTQYTMQSITPSLARSSVTSEIYRNDATLEPMPTTIIRAAPRMVSVKGSPATGPSNSPTSTLVASPATHVRPVQISSGKVTMLRQPSDVSSVQSKRLIPPSPLTEVLTDTEDEDEHWRARQSLVRSGDSTPTPTTTTQHTESPFSDENEHRVSTALTSSPKPNPYAAMSASVGTTSDGRSRRPDRNGNFGALTAVAEEANRTPAARPNVHDNSPSPFSDIYMT